MVRGNTRKANFMDLQIYKAKLICLSGAATKPPQISPFFSRHSHPPIHTHNHTEVGREIDPADLLFHLLKGTGRELNE